MYSQANKQLNLRPSLLFSGIILPITGVLSILLLTSTLVSQFTLPSYLGLLNTIFYYVAITSLILILIQIAISREDKRNTVIAAIVFILAFVGGEIAIYSIPNIAYLGGGWGAMGVFIVIATIKLTAFILANKSLNLPEKKYGTPLLVIFGLLYLLDTLAVILFAFAGMFIPDADIVMMLHTIMYWLGIVFIYMEHACMLGIGIKFISDGINHPVVEGTTVSRTQTRTTPTPIKHDDFFSAVPTTTYESSSQEEILTYCSYCGAQTFKGNSFCENCGQKLE